VGTFNEEERKTSTVIASKDETEETKSWWSSEA